MDTPMSPSPWQEEFLLDDDILYLNHAAVAPWPRRTRDAVIRFAEDNAHLGSKHYMQWIEVEQELRERLARLIHAPSPDDIALLKNTSEALSVVAHGLPWTIGDNIVTSNEEFPSNRIVWESLADHGVKLRQVDLHTADSPEDALLDQIDSNTRLLAISSVEYASGLRLDLERLGSYCRENDIFFCVDAIQSIGAVDLDVQAIHADFVMADGHKWMLGPEGLALFYVRPMLRHALQLHQFGWHMVEEHMNFNTNIWQPAHSARRFECGSPNMMGIHALHASVGLLLEIGMETVESRVRENSLALIEQIDAHPELELVTMPSPERLAGIVTFRRKAVDSEALYKHLMSSNVMCAYRGGGIRFSAHFYTPRSVLERALEMVLEAEV
jgi:selenocysteine lyase/cysteine desulfurase